MRMSRPPSFSMASLMARFISSSFVRSATMDTPCFSWLDCSKSVTNVSVAAAYGMHYKVKSSRVHRG